MATAEFITVAKKDGTSYGTIPMETYNLPPREGAFYIKIVLNHIEEEIMS
jgi:hypothetical protein